MDIHENPHAKEIYDKNKKRGIGEVGGNGDSGKGKKIRGSTNTRNGEKRTSKVVDPTNYTDDTTDEEGEEDGKTGGKAAVDDKELRDTFKRELSRGEVFPTKQRKQKDNGEPSPAAGTTRCPVHINIKDLLQVKRGCELDPKETKKLTGSLANVFLSFARKNPGWTIGAGINPETLKECLVEDGWVNDEMNLLFCLIMNECFGISSSEGKRTKPSPDIYLIDSTLTAAILSDPVTTARTYLAVTNEIQQLVNRGGGKVILMANVNENHWVPVMWETSGFQLKYSDGCIEPGSKGQHPGIHRRLSLFIRAVRLKLGLVEKDTAGSSAEQIVLGLVQQDDGKSCGWHMYSSILAWIKEDMEEKNQDAKETVRMMNDMDALYMKAFIAFYLSEEAARAMLSVCEIKTGLSDDSAKQYPNVYEALNHLRKKIISWSTSETPNPKLNPYTIGPINPNRLPKNLQSVKNVDGSVLAAEVSSGLERMVQGIVDGIGTTGNTFAIVVINTFKGTGTYGFTFHRFVDEGHGKSFRHYALDFKFTHVQDSKNTLSVRIDISNGPVKSYRAARRDEIALILPEEFRQQLLDWCNGR
jgi:hypothetical protein